MALASILPLNEEQWTGYFAVRIPGDFSISTCKDTVARVKDMCLPVIKMAIQITITICCIKPDKNVIFMNYD